MTYYVTRTVPSVTNVYSLVPDVAVTNNSVTVTAVQKPFMDNIANDYVQTNV